MEGVWQRARRRPSHLAATVARRCLLLMANADYERLKLSITLPISSSGSVKANQATNIDDCKHSEQEKKSERAGRERES